MDVIYLFRVLLKRKWIIIGTAVIAVAVAYFLTSKQPKYYKSSAQISTGFALSDEIKVNNENFSMFEADTRFNNAIVTWTSPTVMSLLSYTLILHDLENTVNPFRVLNMEKKKSQVYRSINVEEAKRTYRNKLESMSVLTSFNPEQKNLLEFLSLYGYDYKTIGKGLSIARVPNTDYIQIDCITENPELSAFIANNTFQQFLRYYKNVRSNRSQESIDTLQSLLEKKKQELDAKNALLRQNGTVDIGQESTSNLELIMNLETTLTDAKSKLTSQQFSLQRLNQKLAVLGVDKKTGTPPHANNQNNELVILRNAVSEAYTAYVNGGSSDPALLKRYNQLNAEYQTKAAEVQSGSQDLPATPENSKSGLLDAKADLELSIQASNTNIASIQDKINSLKSNLTKDASKNTILEALLKDAELANKEYLAAKQKYNDAMDITTSSVNNFRQVLMGQPAIEPEPSKRMLIVGMAGASSMIFTVLIIIVLASLDSSIKTPVIFSKTVGLKLISMVNFMNLKQKSLREVSTVLDTVPDHLNNKRHNVFREALRKLRHEVESSGKKIFLFASTKKGEGKTTLIEALSYSMSLSKKKILIIDTNFCNNDLTLRLNADPILEKIHPDKANMKSLIDQVKEAAKDIGVGSVFAIGSEGGDYTPSEILPRENLLHHLQALTAEYDYIFLEGPPLNDFSDARELVQYVDGVIAVFSAHHIIKQVDKASISFFGELNGKFCGAVLNMVDPENVNVT